MLQFGIVADNIPGIVYLVPDYERWILLHYWQERWPHQQGSPTDTIGIPSPDSPPTRNNSRLRPHPPQPIGTTRFVLVDIVRNKSILPYFPRQQGSSTKSVHVIQLLRPRAIIPHSVFMLHKLLVLSVLV